MIPNRQVTQSQVDRGRANPFKSDEDTRDKSHFVFVKSVIREVCHDYTNLWSDNYNYP